MLVVAHVLIAVTRGNAGLAHDDDAGWAAINAESTAGTNVFVNDENNMVIRIGAWGNHINGIGDGAGGKHVDALPRANVDASFTHDAFRLVDMEKLLWFDALVQIVDRDFSEGVATGKRWHWW